MEIDHKQTLPLELIELICEFCDDKSLLEILPRTAKAFWTVLSNDNFWRRRSDAKKIKYIDYDARKSCRYHYKKNLQYYPDVQWSEVYCTKEVKDRLMENFLLPIKFPLLFTGRYRLPRAALLYGPRGVDKSMLAKVIASEAKATYFSLKCSDLYTKEGNAARKLRDFFTRANDHTPAILFIDEIESIDGVSSVPDNRAKVEFLVHFHRRKEGVYIIAASDMPWNIGPAVRRRFEQRLWVDLPDLDTRVTLLKQYLVTLPNDLTEEDFTKLGHSTINYSPNEISLLVREASMNICRTLLDATHFKIVSVPLQEDTNNVKEYYTPCSPGDASGSPMQLNDVPQDKLLVPKITNRHLELALTQIKPSITQQELDLLAEFRRDFGSD